MDAPEFSQLGHVQANSSWLTHRHESNILTGHQTNSVPGATTCIFVLFEKHHLIVLAKTPQRSGAMRTTEPTPRSEEASFITFKNVCRRSPNYQSQNPKSALTGKAGVAKTNDKVVEAALNNSDPIKTLLQDILQQFIFPKHRKACFQARAATEGQQLWRTAYMKSLMLPVTALKEETCCTTTPPLRLKDACPFSQNPQPVFNLLYSG